MNITGHKLTQKLPVFILLIGSTWAGGAGVAFSKGHAVTRAELLEGCPYPERREFAVTPEISPCQDLYQHVCKKAIDGFKLPEDRSRHAFAFNDASERLLYAKKKFAMALRSADPVTARSKQLKAVVSACMDEAASQKEEKTWADAEVQALVRLQERAQVRQHYAKRLESGEWSPIELMKIPNLKNPAVEDVIFMPVMMVFPERSYSQKKETLNDLQKLAEDFFKTIGWKDAKKSSEYVAQFEKKMGEVSPLPAEIRNRVSQSNYLTRDQLTQQLDGLDLSQILKRLPAKVQIRSLVPESLAWISSFFKEAPIEELKSVIAFYSMQSVLDDAYPEYQKRRFEFVHKHLGGPAVRPDRAERCTQVLMTAFARELDAELMPILFPKFPKQKVVEVVLGARNALVAQIKENQWLSPSAKKEAIQKVSSAHLMLIAPNNDRDWDFNPPAQYSSTRPIANLMLLKGKLFEKMMGELSKPRVRTQWLRSPLEVNAYYTPPDNTFVLHQAILQPPFFDPEAPARLNYATMGMVVGHELGHGIDDQGSQYDHTGKVAAWMTPTDREQFAKLGQVFIEQFNQIGHDGKLTLGENIGDHVGLKTAVRAASAKKALSKEEAQEFFKQYARLWCQVIRPSTKEMQLKTDPHSLGEARVNEQVKHMPEFQKAFECKAGDALYLAPEKQIHIW